MPEAKEATYICKLQEAKPEKNEKPFFLVYHSIRTGLWVINPEKHPNVQETVRAARRTRLSGFTHIHVFRLPDLPCEGCEINADAALEEHDD